MPWLIPRSAPQKDPKRTQFNRPARADLPGHDTQGDTQPADRIRADQLKGGLEEEEALAVISQLDTTGIDLIDISGGTYFPGADLIGLARALVLCPDLPNRWLANQSGIPAFPKFSSPPEGGITAWYTMRLTQLAQDSETDEIPDLETMVRVYNERDKDRVAGWNNRFRS